VHSEYQILNEITSDLDQIKIIVNCKETAGNICNDCPAVDSCADMKK
jgi:hypothetical protein